MEYIIPAKQTKLRLCDDATDIAECNSVTAKYGLVLSEKQIHELAVNRLTALRETGRVEFGEGILKKLIYAFCDSPYIAQDNYWKMLIVMQEKFYQFKNQSRDKISDDELIELMEKTFNGWAGGSLEYLISAFFEELRNHDKETENYTDMEDSVDMW